MEEIERGANEFEWEVSAPNYQILSDPFSIFDTTAIVICVSNSGKEFLRINYLVTHSYDNEEMKENPPEEINWSRLIRVVNVEKPRINQLDIDWNN